MALEISARADSLSKNRVVTPNIILEIDGVDTRYSTTSVLKYARYGDVDLEFGEDVVFGGSIVDPSTKPYVSSGNTITQQLLQDKGAASSVTSLQLDVIDKNKEISYLISPGFVVDEVLARRATVYLNFGNANDPDNSGYHPEDSVIIHRGIIDNISSLSGYIKFNIASPEQLKRQSIFLKQEAEIDGAINNSVTTITVVSTEGFIDPSTEIHTSYIKIDDEIIQWTSKSATQFLGCTRGALGTVAASHDDEAAVESFYRIQGNAIDLALKIMLSGGDEYFVEDAEPLHIGCLDPSTPLATAVFFNIPDVQEKYGLSTGDFLSITGSTSNDVVDALIISFSSNSSGSWIVTDQSFTLETLTPGLVSFKSQYSTLNEGMAMTPQDVDVEKHLDIFARFSSSIASYDFYIKDTINGKDFLSSEIYLPAGLYALPRKTKASVGITLPPIADTNISTFDSENIISPSKLSSERSVNKNFYNSVIIKYDELPLEDKFISGKVTYSADSQARFKTIGNRPLKIISKGLRPGADTDTLIRVNSRRWLERYEFAAESIPKITVLFKDGFKIDVGDTVIFGDNDLQMTDTTTGDRNREPRLYEVVNKSLNIKTGEVTLDLLSTNFALNGRYGIISPSTLVDTGSTTSSIMIKSSYSTVLPDLEKDKWASYIGLNITIHSADWTYSEDTTLVGFSLSDDYEMLVDPPVSSPPSENYIIDISEYNDTTDASVNYLYKIIHCFFDPTLIVTSGSSSTVFSVSAGDAAKAFVGGVIRVHNYDFSIDSGEVNISDITGTAITVDSSLGFTPSAGQFVDLVGFKDLGSPFRLV